MFYNIITLLTLIKALMNKSKTFLLIMLLSKRAI